MVLSVYHKLQNITMMLWDISHIRDMDGVDVWYKWDSVSCVNIWVGAFLALSDTLLGKV